MLVNVLFVSREGKVEVYDKKVDLDYWNIRQWRRLYFHLYDKNKNLNPCDFVRLVIQPINDIIF